jgi:hypothetical protein
MPERLLQETRDLERALVRHHPFRDITKAYLLVNGELSQQTNTLEFSFRGTTYIAEVSIEGIRLKRPVGFTEIRDIGSIIPSGMPDTAGAVALILNLFGAATL